MHYLDDFGTLLTFFMNIFGTKTLQLGSLLTLVVGRSICFETCPVTASLESLLVQFENLLIFSTVIQAKIDNFLLQ